MSNLRFAPAFVVFIGYGAYSGLQHLLALGKRSACSRTAWRAAIQGGFALILALPVCEELLGNWEVNDYSHDTAINDFYENVFEVLPEGSVLVEDYWVVVPADTPSGSLELAVAQSDMLGNKGERLTLEYLLISEGG